MNSCPVVVFVVAGISCSCSQTMAPSDLYSLILNMQITGSLFTAQNNLTLLLESGTAR